MYVLAFIAYIVLGKWRVRHGLGNGVTEKDVDDMLFFGVFGVILGGRLGYVLFYKPLYYLAHPLEVIALWQGGMSFHGGVFRGVVGPPRFLGPRAHRRAAGAPFAAAPRALRAP